MPKLIPLQPGQYYHLYNRGNNRENIFREERNYTYFLRLYAKHIEPVAETYAYCLLRNHFHVLVKIRDAEHLTGLRDLSGVPRKLLNPANLSPTSSTPTPARSTAPMSARAHCSSARLVVSR